MVGHARYEQPGRRWRAREPSRKLYLSLHSGRRCAVIHDMSEEVDQIEAAYNVTLPHDYVSFLNSSERFWSEGEANYLDFWDAARILTSNRRLPQRESHPGLLVIGTDGSREMIAFDFRRQPPPVVLVDMASSGWTDAFLQAPNFTSFLRQVKEEGGLRWEPGYE